MFSSSLVDFVVPGIGTIQGFCASSHAAKANGRNLQAAFS